MVWERGVIEYLYVEGEPESWTPLSSCALLAVDAYAEEPREVEVDGTPMRIVLSGDQVRDVAVNLRAEVAEPTDIHLVAALRHYWEFDGFIPAAALGQN